MNMQSRVMIVDDTPADRSLIVRELKKSFYDLEFIEPTNRREFAEAVASIEFDVVLTNSHLSWSSSGEVLEAVRSRRPNCSVIMFTDAEEFAGEAMQRGFDDYVIKNAVYPSKIAFAVTSAIERINVKKRASQRESRLESLLAKLSVGVYRCTLDGELLEANEAFTKITGAAPGNAVNSNIARLFAKDDLGARFHEILHTGTSVEIETLLERNGDDTIWVHLSGAYYEMPSGTPAIVGLAEDITNRRLAEQQATARGLALARIADLTRRENEVMKRVARGKPNKSVARELGISTKTVEMHRANMMRKLQVDNLAELVRLEMIAQPGQCLQ